MEIRRILKPGGRIALVWNQRDTKTEFQQDYASLLRKHVPSYDDLAHTRIDDEAITEFLDHRTLEYYCFANRQLLDFDGLLGRMQSSSYTPTAGHPAFGQIADELMELFEMKQDNGRIAFDYETRLFVGRLSNG